MRCWETVLWLLLMLPFGAAAVRRTAPQRMIHPLLWVWRGGLLAAMLLQAVLEGWRWQVGGLYLAAILGLAQGLRRRTIHGPKARAYPGSWAYRVILPVVLLSATSAFLLPVPRLEKPEGPYAVGTETFWWKDEQRPEGDGSRPRELAVQIWYPAIHRSSDHEAPYIPGIQQLARMLWKEKRAPVFLSAYLHHTKTFSYEGATLPESGRFPVVLLSHGWPGFRFTYHYLVTGLASQGYVVASIDHTGGAAAAVFPDGHVVLQDPSPKEEDLPAWNRLVDEIWSEDDRFVLNRLMELDNGAPGSRFYHRLDTGRTAVIGHSFGGDNALAVMGKDSRFKAGISLDGAFYGAGPVSLRPGQSFLWLCTAESARRLGLPDGNAEALTRAGISVSSFQSEIRKLERRRDEVLKGGGEMQIVPGAVHSSFSDVTLFSPVIRWVKHAPQPQRMHREILQAVTEELTRRLGSGGVFTYNQTSPSQRGPDMR
ncbi:alpha/beta hydrolase family protein [Gorillibacterium sp. sgz5001074]|uniref:alpha/beta hydrolase family protein n=1 Tax=Gorillibacterium sp. sgz5001074 TaxID=3446695 RepID=UPI003F673AEB